MERAETYIIGLFGLELVVWLRRASLRLQTLRRGRGLGRWEHGSGELGVRDGRYAGPELRFKEHAEAREACFGGLGGVGIAFAFFW